MINKHLFSDGQHVNAILFFSEISNKRKKSALVDDYGSSPDPQSPKKKRRDVEPGE